MMQVEAKVEQWARDPAAAEGQLQTKLETWLPRQRWFAAKGATITSVKIADTAVLSPEAGWLLAEVATAGPEAPSTYQILLSSHSGEPELGGVSAAVVRALWFERLAEAAAVPTGRGTLRFEALAPGLAAASSRVSGAEQSNTSILYADGGGTPRWVLKFFRRLLPGENPEFEIPRALAEHSGFRRVPQALGRVLYHAPGGVYTVATLQEFVANHGDGWAYVLSQLAAGADMRAELALLGRRTAELHQALASITTEPFRPQPIVTADLEHWRRRALAGVEDVRLGSYRDRIAPWRARLAELASSGLMGLEGCDQIRIHGDYHLGQVLKTADDFYIFDFEGEPARPLSERRRRGCVLQDVAGMLRSLSYAAHTARQPGWEPDARQSFLESYLATMRGAEAGSAPRLLPEPAAPALEFFELEKAVYELRYELAHRPEWVTVPLAGLTRLLIP